MTQEEKELVLRDLCARLPYEPIVQWENCNYGAKNKYIVSIDIFGIINNEFSIEECKPYLRLIQSMTEEEKEEYKMTSEPLDWFNEKMFDFRGLIPKGLAIAVTKDNNPYKN